MKRRLLSILLALTMCLTLLPVGAKASSAAQIKARLDEIYADPEYRNATYSYFNGNGMSGCYAFINAISERKLFGVRIPPQASDIALQPYANWTQVGSTVYSNSNVISLLKQAQSGDIFEYKCSYATSRHIAMVFETTSSGITVWDNTSGTGARLKTYAWSNVVPNGLGNFDTNSLYGMSLYRCTKDVIPPVSQKCGDNVTGTLSGSTLTISGSGPMWDYEWLSSPWTSNQSIKSVVIKDGVTAIGYNTFTYCSELTSITLPDSMASIRDGAFYGCSSISSVTIPKSVASIGDRAFSACNSLQSFLVNSENAAYSSQNGVLFNKGKSLLIQYPAGRQTTAYAIPSGVTRIESYAFYDSDALKSVTIPTSVSSIGYQAFYECGNLTDVYYDGTEAQWKAIEIGDDNGPLINATIHCTTPTTYYTVTFNSNGGSAVASQTVESGKCATRPANPAKAGYTFVNWYKDTALTQAYNFSTPVTSSFTLYAKWNQSFHGADDLTASVNGSSVTLRWSAIPGASAYVVFYDGSWLTPVSGTSYTHANVPAGDHFYNVIAWNPSQGYSPWGKVNAWVTVESAALRGADDLTASVSGNNVTLNWSAIPGADAYVVFYDGSWLTPVSGTSYTHANVPAGDHFYNVIAWNAAQGYSPWGKVNAWVTVSGGFHGADDLTASVNGDVITLRWSAVSGADAYVVFVDGQWYDTTTRTVFSIVGLNPGEHWFNVIAWNAAQGYSGWGNNAYVTVGGNRAVRSGDAQKGEAYAN